MCGYLFMIPKVIRNRIKNSYLYNWLIDLTMCCFLLGRRYIYRMHSLVCMFWLGSRDIYLLLCYGMFRVSMALKKKVLILLDCHLSILSEIQRRFNFFCRYWNFPFAWTNVCHTMTDFKLFASKLKYTSVNYIL